MKAAAGDEAERELREGWEVVAGKAGKRKARASPPASEVSRVRREASEAAVQGLYVPTESETEYVHAALREIEAATEEPEEMWRARGASGPRPGLRGNNVMGCSLHYATAHEAGRLGPIHGDDSGPPSAVVVVSLSCGGCVPPFVVTVEDREAARRASYLACREMRWLRVRLHDSLAPCACASGAVCSRPPASPDRPRAWRPAPRILFVRRPVSAVRPRARPGSVEWLMSRCVCARTLGLVLSATFECWPRGAHIDPHSRLSVPETE